MDERDHKKLGKELGLYIIDETVGKGLPMYLPKGAAIRRELERFIVDEEIKRGYLHVITPDIARLELYKKSGHYPYYKDSMYAPIVIEDDEYMLRPMTCPHHFQLYLSKPRSYRELPMRIAELAKLYRYEQSGELMGLIRTREFCLSDAHIVCASEEQAVEEIGKALELVEYANGIFGLEYGKDYWYKLSLGDRNNPEKYGTNNDAWDKSEDLMRKFLKNKDYKFEEVAGDAAFYGPKIDVQMKNANGKEDTAFTVQYDFCMPERFNMNYIGEDGKEHRAFVVHRSSIGSIGRTMALLIEKYAGAFPLWLSPVQAKILTVADTHKEYAKNVFDNLMNAGIRAELDDSNETLGKKVRNAKTEKVNYMLVIGDKEVESNNLSIESRDSGKLGEKTIDSFIEHLKKEIADKK